jgi:transcription elongation GreA/GreB family factor
MRRKSELEAQLVRARGTDYSNPRTDVVGIGTIVKVVDPATQNPETFSVLGAWDSEPEKGIISYLTPVAQAMFGRKVGEECDVEMDGASRRLRIESIAAYKTA